MNLPDFQVGDIFDYDNDRFIIDSVDEEKIGVRWSNFESHSGYSDWVDYWSKSSWVILFDDCRKITLIEGFEV